MANLELPAEINLLQPLDGRHRSETFSVKGFLVHAMGQRIAIGAGVDAADFLKRGGLSAHYLIQPDGTAIQLVNTDSGANHAGQSEFNGLKSLNNHFLSAELLVEGTHDLQSLYDAMENEPYTQAQINTLAAIITAAKRAYGFGDDMITGHSIASPGRKRDPGPQVIRLDGSFSQQFQDALDEWETRILA